MSDSNSGVDWLSAFQGVSSVQEFTSLLYVFLLQGDTSARNILSSAFLLSFVGVLVLMLTRLLTRVGGRLCFGKSTASFLATVVKVECFAVAHLLMFLYGVGIRLFVVTEGAVQVPMLGTVDQNVFLKIYFLLEVTLAMTACFSALQDPIVSRWQAFWVGMRAVFLVTLLHWNLYDSAIALMFFSNVSNMMENFVVALSHFGGSSVLLIQLATFSFVILTCKIIFPLRLMTPGLLGLEVFKGVPGYVSIFIHVFGGLYVLWSCVLLTAVVIMVRNVWVFRSWGDNSTSLLYSMQDYRFLLSSILSVDRSVLESCLSEVEESFEPEEPTVFDMCTRMYSTFVSAYETVAGSFSSNILLDYSILDEADLVGLSSPGKHETQTLPGEDGSDFGEIDAEEEREGGVDPAEDQVVSVAEQPQDGKQETQRNKKGKKQKRQKTQRQQVEEKRAEMVELKQKEIEKEKEKEKEKEEVEVEEQEKGDELDRGREDGRESAFSSQKSALLEEGEVEEQKREEDEKTPEESVLEELSEEESRAWQMPVKPSYIFYFTIDLGDQPLDFQALHELVVRSRAFTSVIDMDAETRRMRLIVYMSSRHFVKLPNRPLLISPILLPLSFCTALSSMAIGVGSWLLNI